MKEGDAETEPDRVGTPAAGNAKLVIGLVGQVCAGKSVVADAFHRHGARVYEADKAVHEIYRRPEVIAEVQAAFGTGVLDAEGQVDRKELAKIVFEDEAKLKVLTKGIIFPRVIEELKHAFEAFRRSDAPALVLDAPTLFEAGTDSQCDNIVYVAAPRQQREAWAQKRGWPSGELGRREKMLEQHDGEKRRRADAIIDNAGTLDELDRQAGRLMRLWLMQ